jgi:predicted RNA polymerase sigma factor
LYAAKADLLRRAGANDEAILAYQQALTLVSNESERATCSAACKKC